MNCDCLNQNRINLRKKGLINVYDKRLCTTQYRTGSYQEMDDSSCAYRPQHCSLLIAQNPQAILDIQNSQKIYIPKLNIKL